MAVSLLLVEDDAFTRATLAAALKSYGLRSISAVGSAREALAFEDLPEVAVLDLDLGPGPTGIDLAIALRERRPDIGIILLTSYDDPRLIAADLPAAPRGTRHLRKREIEDIAVVASTITAAATYPHAPTAVPSIDLSEAQIEVLRAVAEGLSTAEIARQRGVSVNAVEHAITRLCEHFGLERDSARNQRVRLAAEYHALTGQSP